MAEISEDEDALLARLLLDTDLVSEEKVEKVRQLKESLREQGVKVSIVDLLIQNGFLSRSELNTLRALANEETGEGTSIMPPRFENPFLTQQDLAVRARKQGVISDETFETVQKIQKLLKKNNVNKSGGEILVEQGFVEPHALDFDEEEQEEEGTLDVPLEHQEDLASTSPGQETEGETIKKSSVISELDRYVFEELVDRGRIERAQIPNIVKKARKEAQGDSGASPVQDVLREQGVLHPSTESEILSAAMERRDEAQQWNNQFTGAGPMIVTAVLIICVIGVFFLTYGSGEEGTVEQDPAAKDPVTKQENPATNRTGSVQRDARTSDRQPSAAEKEEEEKQPSRLITFQAEVGRLLSGFECECNIEFDGQEVTSISGTVADDGTVQIKALSRSDRDRLAPGVYVLNCTVNEPPGKSFPIFPDQFRNPLEEYGPTGNRRFEDVLEANSWNFVTVSGIGSTGVDVGREEYALQLRNNLQAIIDQWNRVEPLLSENDPENRRLLDEYGKLYKACQKMVEKLNSRAKYQSFYYPALRERVRDQLKNLPRVIARVMIQQRRQQGIEVTAELRKLSGSGSGGSMQSIRAIIETIREKKNQLPGEDESPDPYHALEPVVKNELQKLAEVVRVLSLLRNNEEVGRLAIEQQQDMAKFAFESFFRYAHAQIGLRSVLLDRTSRLRVFDESTAERVDGLSGRVRTYLRLVLSDLANEHGIDLRSEITDVDGSTESVKEDILDRFNSAGIDVLGGSGSE